MTKTPQLFIGDISDSTLVRTLKRIDEESQPVKDISELGLVNNIRRINGLEPYTVKTWNAMYFPSSSLH